MVQDQDNSDYAEEMFQGRPNDSAIILEEEKALEKPGHRLIPALGRQRQADF